MENVTISVSYILQFAFTGLIGLVFFFSKNEYTRLENRVSKIEEKQIQITHHIDSRFGEIKDLIADLKLQLVTNHPTREEIRLAFDYINKHQQKAHDDHKV